MRVIVCACLCVCAWASLVSAEAVLCGDTTRLVYFRGRGDPTTAPVCSAPYTQTILSAEDTAAQRSFFEGMARKDHIKVVSGLMVEMTQGEKDAVDAALVAADPHKPYKDDIAANNLCDTATLATVTGRLDTVKAALDTDINAVTNIATAKTALANLNTAYAAAFKKIATCIVDRRFVR